MSLLSRTDAHVRLDAEEAVIGAMLTTEPAIDDALATGLVRDEFYWQQHRLAFEVITRLHSEGKPADLISVADALEREEGLEKAGGRAGGGEGGRRFASLPPGCPLRGTRRITRRSSGTRPGTARSGRAGSNLPTQAGQTGRLRWSIGSPAGSGSRRPGRGPERVDQAGPLSILRPSSPAKYGSDPRRCWPEPMASASSTAIASTLSTASRKQARAGSPSPHLPSGCKQVSTSSTSTLRGPAWAIERLLALGVQPEAIDELFHYVRPDEPLGEQDWADLEPILAQEPALTVIDWLTEALTMHGVDPSEPLSSTDLRPAARSGS